MGPRTNEYTMELQVGVGCELTLETPFCKLDESDPELQTLLCSRVYSNLG